MTWGEDANQTIIARLVEKGRLDRRAELRKYREELGIEDPTKGPSEYVSPASPNWPDVRIRRFVVYGSKRVNENGYTSQVTPKVGLELIGELSRQRRSESELINGLFPTGLDAISYANQNRQDGALDAALWIMK